MFQRQGALTNSEGGMGLGTAAHSRSQEQRTQRDCTVLSARTDKAETFLSCETLGHAAQVSTLARILLPPHSAAGGRDCRAPVEGL